MTLYLFNNPLCSIDWSDYCDSCIVKDVEGNDQVMSLKNEDESSVMLHSLIS
jgi:hypothetical protein